MSGGHYNYAHSHIRDCADAIEYDVRARTDAYKDLHGYEYEPLPPDILTLMRKAAATLRLAAQMAHDIEWYMSGAYGDNTLRKCAAEWGKAE